MAGEITETGELYSPYVGLVYMFNLIVGTGALTMPKAFATAGWLVSLVLLVFLGFMRVCDWDLTACLCPSKESFVTTTFVVEAMAAANAQLHWKRMENHQKEDDGDSSTASDSDSLLQDSHERAEKRPILSVQRRGSPNLFEITDRVEMGQMASMFFNKVGVNLFYFCIIIYLYGDLAIYAAAVPFSLMQVSCSAIDNDSCGVEAHTKHNDTDLCWGPLRRADVYHIYLAVFTLLLGPFAFFDVQKTKYLQILTSLMRWIGGRQQCGIRRGETDKDPSSAASWEGPRLRPDICEPSEEACLLAQAHPSSGQFGRSRLQMPIGARMFSDYSLAGEAVVQALAGFLTSPHTVWPLTACSHFRSAAGPEQTAWALARGPHLPFTPAAPPPCVRFHGSASVHSSHAPTGQACLSWGPRLAAAKAGPPSRSSREDKWKVLLAQCLAPPAAR
ncbi:transmembrane protein 104 isoform X6 [Pteropus medius]|uniref:transmembrane protein 104 isoform X6 n=1 Tax=Pteropus vampyrus TaxID=132908 RepID=UPI00196B9326|nr:transmembrane protein 104 isoform X6 [Pteropus giganteus]